MHAGKRHPPAYLTPGGCIGTGSVRQGQMALTCQITPSVGAATIRYRGFPHRPRWKKWIKPVFVRRGRIRCQDSALLSTSPGLPVRAPPARCCERGLAGARLPWVLTGRRGGISTVRRQHHLLRSRSRAGAPSRRRLRYGAEKPPARHRRGATSSLFDGSHPLSLGSHPGLAGVCSTLQAGQSGDHLRAQV